MDTTDILILGGLGLLYFLMRPSSAYPQSYPSPITGTTPKPAQSAGSGGSIGGGSGGAGSVGGSSAGSSGGFTPAPGSGPWQGPLQPGGTQPVDSGDPCDYMSVAYDPTACAAGYGSTTPTSDSTDSMDPCDPNSSVYDPNTCATGSF